MEELAGVTRMMHCYYSNLIEGQQTLVPDIEAALRNDFSAEPEKRDMQGLALAHLACQDMGGGLHGVPLRPGIPLRTPQPVLLGAPAFALHRHHAVRRQGPMTPGVLRTSNVQVGAHVAPPFELLPG